MIEIKTAAILTSIFGIVGIASATLADLLGGYDVTLEHLILFMGIDFLFGIMVASVGRSDKSDSGRISSKAMLEGFCKKIGMVFVVIVFEGIDTIFEIDYLRNVVIYAFIFYEVTSILEHAVSLGLPGFLGKYKIIIENLFDIHQKRK